MLYSSDDNDQDIYSLLKFGKVYGSKSMKATALAVNSATNAFKPSVKPPVVTKKGKQVNKGSSLSALKRTESVRERKARRKGSIFHQPAPLLLKKKKKKANKKSIVAVVPAVAKIGTNLVTGG